MSGGLCALTVLDKNSFLLLLASWCFFFFFLERQSLTFLVGALIQSRGHLLPVCLVIFIFYTSVSVSKLHPFIKYII